MLQSPEPPPTSLPWVLFADEVMRSLLAERERTKKGLLPPSPPVKDEKIPEPLKDFIYRLKLHEVGMGVRDVWNPESLQREFYSYKNSDVPVAYVDPDTLEERELDVDARVRLLISELIQSLETQTNLLQLDGLDGYQKAAHHILAKLITGHEDDIHEDMISVVETMAEKLQLVKIEIRTSQPQTKVDSLTKEIDEALEVYINQKLDEVMSEAEDIVKKAHAAPEKGDTGEAEDGRKQRKGRRTVPTEILEKIRAEERKFQERIEAEGLYGKYVPAHAKVAPAWMKLNPGEIFVDEKGEVYASLKPDEYIDTDSVETDSNGKVYYRIGSRTLDELSPETADTFDLRIESLEGEGMRRSYLESEILGSERANVDQLRTDVSPDKTESSESADSSHQGATDQEGNPQIKDEL